MVTLWEMGRSKQDSGDQKKCPSQDRSGLFRVEIETCDCLKNFNRTAKTCLTSKEDECLWTCEGQQQSGFFGQMMHTAGLPDTDGLKGNVQM